MTFEKKDRYMLIFIGVSIGIILLGIISYLFIKEITSPPDLIMIIDIEPNYRDNEYLIAVSVLVINREKKEVDCNIDYEIEGIRTDSYEGYILNEFEISGRETKSSLKVFQLTRNSDFSLSASLYSLHPKTLIQKYDIEISLDSI